VNIALANELALICDRLGVSSWEVIEAAASKPFAFMAHYPGPGLGGDCIPVAPHFLSWRLREYGYSTRLIDAAHEINAYMPIHVVSKIADALNSRGKAIRDKRLLLMGAAYKADVHDTRESPSLVIMRSCAAPTCTSATRGSPRWPWTVGSTAACSGVPKRSPRLTAW
jgi:UDP-N-acetyl-D-glucosamine dehydrogenase